MTYFNLIKIIESTGIGLIYGLRFYNNGELQVEEVVTYVQVGKISLVTSEIVAG